MCQVLIEILINIKEKYSTIETNLNHDSIKLECKSHSILEAFSEITSFTKNFDFPRELIRKLYNKKSQNAKANIDKN